MDNWNLELLTPTFKLKQLVKAWFDEDVSNFDYGALVAGEYRETAVILCKTQGILAGVPFINAIFQEVRCVVKWFHKEGDLLQAICKVAEVSGRACDLLLAERTALNCLARASGIATQAKHLRDRLNDAGWRGSLAGTRKTTPGFRLVEKYALLVAGVSTHRFDLSSMVMLKDNHIWAAGNISKAVQDVRKVSGFSLKVEVECRSVEEAREAVQAGADVIMLDNFTPKALWEASTQLKNCYPHITVEASGGINSDNITEFAGPCVDVISMSVLTQGYGVLDFSMKILKEGRDPENPAVE